MRKKFVSKVLMLVSTMALLSGCAAAPNGAVSGTVNGGAPASAPTSTPSSVPANGNGEDVAAKPEEEQSRHPKYVFLFIGDGMSFPQFQSAADYLGAMDDSDYMKAVPSLEDNQGAVLDGPVALKD